MLVSTFEKTVNCLLVWQMSGDGCYDGAMISFSAVSPCQLCHCTVYSTVYTVHCTPIYFCMSGNVGWTPAWPVTGQTPQSLVIDNNPLGCAGSYRRYKTIPPRVVDTVSICAIEWAKSLCFGSFLKALCQYLQWEYSEFICRVLLSLTISDLYCGCSCTTRKFCRCVDSGAPRQWRSHRARHYYYLLQPGLVFSPHGCCLTWESILLWWICG